MDWQYFSKARASIEALDKILISLCSNDIISAEGKEMFIANMYIVLSLTESIPMSHRYHTVVLKTISTFCTKA